MVSFTPIHEEDFAEFLRESLNHFIEDLQVSEKISLKEAKTRAQSQMSTVLPDGINSTGHLFFHIIDESKKVVGYFWLLIKEEKKEAFVFDIMIHSDQRGKGYGKAAMILGEKIARENGAEKIWLHVIAQNTIALALYRKLGYEIFKTYPTKNSPDAASYNMTKNL